MPTPSSTRAVSAAIAQESLRNISGSAAAAALQERLAAEGLMPRHVFQIAYAAARLTPGTNLLALYALLGHRLMGNPFDLLPRPSRGSRSARSRSRSA